MNPDPSHATRFQPGCAPGPGRPRSKPLTDRLRERLLDPALVDELVDAWIAGIKGRDVGALRALLDRLEGKVKEQVEHEGSVTIRVEYADVPDAHDHAAEAPPDAG